MTAIPVSPIPVDDADLARPSRRSVVQWLAASMALAATGCTRTPTDRIQSEPRLPEIEANGTPTYHASACLHGGFAHGVLVGSQQGRPMKVEGNPDHPASLGGTSVFAQASILDLWDPDRSTAVWHRRDDAHATPSTWTAFDAAWRGRGDAGPVHVLTPRFTSPTFAAQLAALLARRPGSHWYLDDAGGGDNALQGAIAAFGRPVRAVPHADRAELIVAFGGDPFEDPAFGVRFAADWSLARRGAVDAGRPPPRTIALETTPGLFGARADERFALAPAAIETVLRASAATVLDGLPTTPVDGALQPIVARLTALFAARRGRTLVCGGPSLSPAAHALLLALNQRLGVDCVALIAAPDRPTELPPPGTLAALVDAMRTGVVTTLLIADGNPVYSAAQALGFAEALARVPFSAQLGLHRDETAARCTWHLPGSHDFEQWADARAFDGSATLLQPAIAPLYDTRSPIEWLATLVGDPNAPKDTRSLLRARWQSPEPPGDVEPFWVESLRRGVVAGSAFPTLDLPPATLPTEPPRAIAVAPGTLWCVFPADASVGDGAQANNGWLQELPRPFTKMTWDNALLLGPATARSLGLASGDVVVVRAAVGAVDAPVWVQAGHAEGAASLALGHGRRSAGRVGNGVGADTAALRAAAAGAVAIRLKSTGRRHRFALTQVETDEHGRDLARVRTLADTRESGQARESEKPSPSLYPADPIASDGPAWAMTIDLDACIGCNVCTIACQAENNIPVVGPDEVRVGRVMHWIRVDTYRDEEADRTVSQPVPCMHCEKAPCEVVCPVGATLHDGEGLNLQVYNRCVGTRFCSNNCPYKVRRFNFRQYADVKTETLKLMHNPNVTVRSRGVMEKCSYCVQRLSQARRDVQKSGQPTARDSVETACQSACPTGAIHFGDLHDPGSDVVRAKGSPRHYAMLGELNTRPRTTYLARIAAGKDEA